MPVVSWGKYDREPIDANSYLVEVMDYEFGTSQKGNKKIVWTHKIVGPDENEYIGRTLKCDSQTLTDKAMWKLAWFISACGISTKGLPDMNTGSTTFQKVLETCRGRKLWVTVTVDTWDGKKNNKITDYLKYDDQEPIESLDLDDVPDFVKNKGNGEDKVPF